MHASRHRFRTAARRLAAAALLLAAATSALAFRVGPDVFEEMVPMPDGTRLYTTGTRPKAGAKMPVVVIRTPYADESEPGFLARSAMLLPAYLRGYAVVFQHCRGTGRSEGDFVPFENERADGLALLDWIRARPWYNGEIFLVGGSYHSSAHWAWLDVDPPDVKGAVMPVMDVDAYNCIYRNGFFKTGLYGVWFAEFYRKRDRSLRRDDTVRLSDFPLADFSRRRWGATVPSFDNVVAHPRRDDPFWRSGEPGSASCSLRAFAGSSVPVLLVTGFFDPFCEGMFDMWRDASPERRANCAFLVDAMDHGGDVAPDMKRTPGDFPGGRRLQNPMRLCDWFDACRSGAPCRFAPRGKVRYYALWENRWIEEDALEDGPRRIDLPLGRGVRSWTYDPRRDLPDFPGSGPHCFGGMRPQPPPDFRDDVVSFVLPPVGERLDVRGRMRASLAVSSDAEDTCFYVRVSVRKGDGRWYLLRDDITSLCADGADYAPGTEKRIEFRFSDLAFRLEPADALRVDVASASSQFAPHSNVKGLQSLVREPKTARNSVRADASSLTLFALPPPSRKTP